MNETDTSPLHTLQKFLTEQSRKQKLEYMEKVGISYGASNKPKKDFVEYDEEFSFTPIK